MTTSRGVLTRTSLAAFTKFCEGLGWDVVPCGAVHEVLRIRHKRESVPLIVHRRDVVAELLTTHGTSDKLARQFVVWAAKQPKEGFKP